MNERAEEPAGPTPQSEEDVFWNTVFYQRLRPVARGWAYRANVADWQGQENVIAEEIISITAVKLIQYQQVCRNTGVEIESLEHLMMVIAHRTFLDMRRREGKHQHFSQGAGNSSEPFYLEIPHDPMLEVEDRFYEEWVLNKAARKIASFPPKTRASILSELARLSFSQALDDAFRAINIRLLDYRRPRSNNPDERGRSSALRSLGLKRLAQEFREE